jgi:hypothetical protein
MKTTDRTFEAAFKDLCYLNSHLRMAEVFDLWIEMCALALRNQACKLRNNETEWQENETRYLKIVDEIGGKKGADFAAEAFSIFSESMLENPCDFLGQFYMSREMGNERAGQFFTPYSVSKMLSGITVKEAKEKISQFSSLEVLSINDPTCGAGGMLVAAADHFFFETNPVSVDKVFFVGQDIDRRCFYMTYVQLCAIGCMGLVILGNTLANTKDRVWETPSSAYFCGYERWQLKRTSNVQTSETEPIEAIVEPTESVIKPQELHTNEEPQYDLFL